MTRQLSFFGGCQVKLSSAGELRLGLVLLARIDQRLAPFQMQPAPVGRVFVGFREFRQRQVRLVLRHQRLAPAFQRIGEVSAFLAAVLNWAMASSALPRASHTRPHVSSAKGKEGPVRVARANQKSARAGWPSRSAICARAIRQG